MENDGGLSRLLKFGRRRRVLLHKPGEIFKDPAGHIYVVGANGEHRRINKSNSRKARRKERARARREALR